MYGEPYDRFFRTNQANLPYIPRYLFRRDRFSPFEFVYRGDYALNFRHGQISVLALDFSKGLAISLLKNRKRLDPRLFLRPCRGFECDLSPKSGVSMAFNHNFNLDNIDFFKVANNTLSLGGHFAMDGILATFLVSLGRDHHLEVGFNRDNKRIGCRIVAPEDATQRMSSMFVESRDPVCSHLALLGFYPALPSMVAVSYANSLKLGWVKIRFAVARQPTTVLGGCLSLKRKMKVPIFGRAALQVFCSREMELVAPGVLLHACADFGEKQKSGFFAAVTNKAVEVGGRWAWSNGTFVKGSVTFAKGTVGVRALVTRVGAPPVLGMPGVLR
jgi:hypothetical protein